MTRLARTSLALAATIVTLAWLSTSEAFAREAPPEFGPLPPAPQPTAGLPIDRLTWIVVGAVLGMAIAAVAVAGYAIVRRHVQQSASIAVS
jgi:hypothetical protein